MEDKESEYKKQAEEARKYTGRYSTIGLAIIVVIIIAGVIFLPLSPAMTALALFIGFFIVYVGTIRGVFIFSYFRTLSRWEKRKKKRAKRKAKRKARKKV